MHEKPNSSDSEKSNDSSDASPVKKGANKPGPRTKKTKAKITEERRKSNRSSSSEKEVSFKIYFLSRAYGTVL